MGVLAAGLALAFMHFHWGLKKVYLRLGLHVSASSLPPEICLCLEIEAEPLRYMPFPV